MEKSKNRQVAKIAVFITSIFVICLSVAYAFINQTLTGSKRQVITAGNLQLELKEANAITLNNAMPMYDEVGLIQKPYTFTLTNNSDDTIPYELRLIDVTSSENKLDTTLVKYGLTRDGKITIKYLSNLIDGVIESGKIQGNETIEYDLRLWIDSKVEDETLILGKTLSYKVEIEVSQVIAKPSMPMMRKRDSYYSTEMFYGYKDQITSMIFEDKIDIPSTISDDKKWDVSAKEGTGQVMAYIEEIEEATPDNPLYRLHIQGKNGVAANTNSNHLFREFKALVVVEGMEYFDTSNVANMECMFSNCDSLTSLDVSHFDTSNVTTMSYTFSSCSSLINLDVSHFDTSKVKNMFYMFGGCKSLASLNVSSFDTSKVVDMKQMFYLCDGLTSLDLSNFNTSDVTNMQQMFYGCSSLTSLDVSHFDTSNVTNMQEMFCECSSLASIDVSSFNTSNVTNMKRMFWRCSSLTSLDVSHFDTSNVIDMSTMFCECSSLASLDVSSFNTSNVTNMSSMFAECRMLTSLSVSSFDTSNVTDMWNIFYECSNLTSLDISNFDTSSVTNMQQMFLGCSSLESLILGEKAIFTKVTKYSLMFYNSNPTVHVKTQEQVDWLTEKFPTLQVEIG